MPVATAFNHSAVKSEQYRKTNERKKKRMESTTHKSRTFLGGVLGAILAVVNTNQYNNLMLSFTLS